MTSAKRTLLIISLSLIAALISGGLVYVAQNKKNSDTKATLQSQIDSLKTQVASATPTPLTNDQIFAEASSQLGLKRADLIYFRIYAQDKIQIGFDGATVFAYKDGGSWHNAGRPSSALLDCSEMTAVPEKYRPFCTDGDQTLYAKPDHSSLNYPIGDSVSYIGE